MAASISPLEQALIECHPSKDVFDALDFNSVSVINKLFPSEQSPGIEQTVDRLAIKLKTLDHSVLKAIEFQSRNGEKVKREIADTKSQILNLGGEISTMKGRAEETGGMVDNLTRDMNSLDTAKRNLTSTITLMRRLSMWISAVENLSLMAERRNYADAANLLEAVAQLGAHFETFSEIDQISQLKKSVAENAAKFKSQIMEEMKQLSLQMSDTTRQNLTDACRAVDALGPAYRKQIIDSFCAREMCDYGDLFDPFKASVTLEVTEKRYIWFKKKLHALRHAYDGVFPASWKINLEFAKAFGTLTRKHLEIQLSKLGNELNVRLLLHVINKTMEAETEITKNLIVDAGGGVIGEVSKSDGMTLVTFIGFISGVFEPYMGLYLKLEAKAMREHIEKLLSQEKWVSNEGKVLESSTELFLYIKASVRQCSAITTKHTLISLGNIFQNNFQLYASALSSHVGTLGKTKNNAEAEAQICAVINTGEYCAETVGQLEETIKRTADPDLAHTLDMSKEKDIFLSVVDTGLSALVTSVLSKIETSFDSMKSINWGVLDTVGDQSPYVSDFSQLLSKLVPPISAAISLSHFKFFCDKFISFFVPFFIEKIFKIKRVSECGVQQLLLDSTYIQKNLLNFPNVAGVQLSSTFSRLVDREMTRVLNILKVLLGPPESIEENFRELVSQGTSADFQRILEMRGIKHSAESGFSASVSSAVSSNLTYFPKVLRDLGGK